MKQTETSNKSRGALGIIAQVVLGSLVIPLAVMNLTPGHLGFGDSGGCTCVVTAGQPDRPPAARRLYRRQIEATDEEIDALVCESYGLTGDEIKIVEEATR